MSFSAPILAWLAASMLLQDGEQKPFTTPAPDRRAELDFQHYYRAEELGRAIAELAQAYPEFVRATALGQGEGREALWVLSVGDQSDPDLANKPAVALVAGLAADDWAGPELCLFTVFDWVQNHERDPRVKSFLASTTLYVIACADPLRLDRVREGAAPAAGSVALESNFPSRWDPFDPAAGPYPLSRPEARDLTEFLARSQSLQVIGLVGGVKPRASAAGAQAAAGTSVEVALLAELRAASPGLRWASGGEALAGRGTLACYAADELALSVFELCAQESEAIPDPADLVLLGQRFSRGVLALGDVLARVRIEPPVAERIQRNTWRVDVAFENVGRLTCRGLRSGDLGRARPTELAAFGEGLTLRGVALSSDGGSTFAPATLRDGKVRVDGLEPGRQHVARWIVAAEGEPRLTFDLQSARAGRMSAAIDLR
jgi:hypothetical protein